MPDTDFNGAYIEIQFSDGTTARWTTTDILADNVAESIEALIGAPDTINL